jgi:hypothetical protein
MPVGPRDMPRLRSEFWRSFKASLEPAVGVTLGRVSSEGYMNVNAGLNCGSLIVMARVRKGEIGVQLTLDDPAAATIFSFLGEHRASIDAAFEMPPIWRAPTARAHEIEVRRPADIGDRDVWPGLHRWLREQLVAFRTVLHPFLGWSPPAGETRRWDEVLFFADLEHFNPAAMPPAQALLDWSRTSMPDVYWGRGRQFGSFVPGLRRRGRVHSVISVWTSGTLVPRFAALRTAPPFDDEALRAELLGRFNRVPHFDLPRDVLDLLPTLPLALLCGDVALERFIEALEWYVAVVKAA